MLLAGCGGSPDVRIAPEHVTSKPEAAPLSAEQSKALAALERLYRADDPAFPAQRDALAKDPANVVWLTRLFVRDAIFAFDRRQASDEDFLRQVSGGDPVWDRALNALRGLGPAAAPTLIDDLLRHQKHDRRRLGVTLLGATGEGSLGAMKELLMAPDPVVRRLAVLAVGEMPPTVATQEALRRAATDKEFTVRAAAYEGMGRGVATAAADLRAALEREADPFVQRVIARALAGDCSKASAQALLGYMRKSLAERDTQGFEVAHQALAKLAGRDPRRARGVEEWANWVTEQPERWEVRDGAVEDRSR